MSEFLEESASEVIDTYLQRLYKIDPNKELSIKDVLYSGFVGAVSGGVTAGVTSGLNAATNRARGETIIKNNNAQTVVNTATYVADKLAASGTDFKNASEWVRTLRGEVDAYNKLVEQGKGESASAHTILGEMQASLFFAETQAINAGITERIKNASEEDRAAMAEYINLNFDKKQRQKDFTAEDIAANTNDITKQLAIMQMAGSPFFNYDAAMADQAQESGIESVIAKEQGKGAQSAESGVQSEAPVDEAFERAAAEARVQSEESAEAVSAYDVEKVETDTAEQIPLGAAAVPIQDGESVSQADSMLGTEAGAETKYSLSAEGVPANGVNFASEAAKASVGAVESGNGEIVTEGKESGESAEKSSESKNKSSETTPSTAEAVGML